MGEELEQAEIILHKTLLMNIMDKQIEFKGSKHYQGLLLLDNSSLIKCSYLVEDKQGTLYIIKVYNFDSTQMAEDFLKNLKEFSKLQIISIPRIIETLFERQALQVSVIEEHDTTLSIKLFLE
jgi:hypothetical protein